MSHKGGTHTGTFMPKVPAYICKNRHGTYYFRLVLPLFSGEHPVRKRREMRKSLKTDSKKLAIRRARKLRVYVDEQLERIEKMIGDDDDLTLEYIMETQILPDGTKKEIKIDTGDPEKDFEIYQKMVAGGLFNKRVGNNVIPELDKSLSEMIEEYLTEKRDIEKNRIKTVDTYRQALELFTEVVGNRTLSSLSHEDFSQFSRVINQLPVVAQ